MLSILSKLLNRTPDSVGVSVGEVKDMHLSDKETLQAPVLWATAWAYKEYSIHGEPPQHEKQALFSHTSTFSSRHPYHVIVSCHSFDLIANTTCDAVKNCHGSFVRNENTSYCPLWLGLWNFQLFLKIKSFSHFTRLL